MDYLRVYLSDGFALEFVLLIKRNNERVYDIF
jgi:hypothetical protein